MSDRSWRIKNPGATAAHNAVQQAIRRGQILPQPCEACGNPQAIAHHDDYSKRLEVRWLSAAQHRATMDDSGFHGHHRHIYRTELEPRVRQLHAEGYTRTATAKLLGISEISIWRWVGSWRRLKE